MSTSGLVGFFFLFLKLAIFGMILGKAAVGRDDGGMKTQ